MKIEITKASGETIVINSVRRVRAFDMQSEPVRFEHGTLAVEIKGEIEFWDSGEHYTGSVPLG